MFTILFFAQQIFCARDKTDMVNSTEVRGVGEGCCRVINVCFMAICRTQLLLPSYSLGNPHATAAAAQVEPLAGALKSPKPDAKCIEGLK